MQAEDAHKKSGLNKEANFIQPCNTILSEGPFTNDVHREGEGGLPKF